MYVGIPLPADVSQSTTTSYSWISNNNGVVFSVSIDTTIDGGGSTSYGKTAYYSTTTAGLNEHNALTEIGSYPNPTKDFSILSFTPSKTGSAYVEVFDCNGKRIAHWNVETVANQNQQLRIKLLTEPVGLYQVRIIENNEVYTSRIMKQ